MAVKFLEDPTMNINEISMRVGYTDTFTFSKAFKRHFGSSPTDYRKTLQNDSIASLAKLKES